MHQKHDLAPDSKDVSIDLAGDVHIKQTPKGNIYFIIGSLESFGAPQLQI